MTTSPQNSETPPATARPVPICSRHDTPKERITNAPIADVAGVEPPQRADPWVCPKCAEEEIARAAGAAHVRHDAERAAGYQRQKQAELEKRIGRACIPKRYLAMTFDTFPGTTDAARKHCSVLRSYANQFPAMSEKGISVLLVGAAGTGKTGLACSVANVVIREHHRTALFTSAYGAVRHLRDTWGRRGRTETEALADLVTPDLLILDEVGTSVGTDAETAALFEVINGRYQERRSTIVLSNLPMDDFHIAGEARPGLRAYLGPRVVDRFRDDGSFTLAFDWPSLRGART